ncbi:MAG: hypothetical protein P4L82_05295 [Ancalomicrobiaceae bacterium]|nr:hypothetical protein [Ancalomicrobiaceae bacterium]
MMKYDAEKLEIAISTRGGSGRSQRWQWMVGERGKGPIKSGSVTGVRTKALAEATDAMNELVSKALQG